MQGGSKLKRILLAVLLGIGLPQSAIASGETIGSVSHIHNVEVFQKDILLGTHEGLYRYEKGGKLILLGEEKFDVMGLTSSGAWVEITRASRLASLKRLRENMGEGFSSR
jgi:hypothetical protein